MTELQVGLEKGGISKGLYQLLNKETTIYGSIKNA